MRSLGWAASGLALLLAAAPAAAQTKSLHWRLLQVNAELDAEGRLHVRERHAMVFTGDWNGGERRFDVRKGQSLRFRGLRRVDPAGARRELRSRQPPDVDEYTWVDATTLRWRSRAPSDPPFRATEIVYELDYTLSNVLVFRDGTYRLDHDFAFPDRPGPIARFVLELRLDRVWRPESTVPPQVTAGPLPQGQGYALGLELTHLGAARPAAVAHGSPGWRRLLLALLAAGALARLVWFWIRERSSGRLDPLVPAARIDTGWLEQNVFHLPAEVVGATWERSIGPAEVAATLARLEAEGRIQTWADPTVVAVRHLRLAAPRTSLEDHERLLIDALLVDGREETDTAEVRKHYKATGFDPASVIRKPLEKRVGELLGRESRGGAVRSLVTAVLFMAAAAALAWAVLREAEVVPLAVAGASLVVYLVGLAFASRWRSRVDGGALAALGLLVPIGLLLAGVAFVDRLEPPASVAALGGSVALALAFLHSLLNRARATESRDALRLRKRLTAAREFLEGELRRGSPEVQESWFPHLLALGLAQDADRWSAARTAAPATVSTWHDDGPSRGSSSTSAPSPGFSAGGGRFGGAGATGSWAATAQAFSASIAAPSSSGSGGGGSSGGGSSSSSSSGGGGGGGW